MQDTAIIKVKVVDLDDAVVYGTAYFINQTHAITSRHVVVGYKSITFKFNGGSEVNKFELKYEDEEFDIALITFSEEILDSIPKVYTTEISKPNVHDKWHGAGFPRLAVDGNCRNMETLKGSCYQCPEGEKFFDLECDKTPKQLDEWGGVSGAPVIVGTKLVGVICKYDTKLEKTHFTASAIWKLLSEDDFFQLYRERRSSVYKEKISDLLSTHIDLKEELDDYFGEKKERVLDEILKQEKNALMEMCLSLQERNKSLGGINELLLYSMAYQYENDECFSQLATEDKPYIDVPVVRVEACEFLMASEDQRKPLFRKHKGVSGKQEVVPGKYAIIAPPEYGIESRAHEDIMDNLMAGKGDYESVVERVFGDYRRSQQRKYDKNNKNKVVVAMLEKSEGTYYWLLEVSDANSSEVKKIFNSLPIKILNMAKDPDVEIDMAEEELFAELGNFIGAK